MYTVSTLICYDPTTTTYIYIQHITRAYQLLYIHDLVCNQTYLAVSSVTTCSLFGQQYLKVAVPQQNCSSVDSPGQ